MPFLTTLGTLEYGNFPDVYAFDASTKVTVSCEMVQDEAQRTVVYQRQTITARATVAVAAGTDTDLESIKAILGEQGSGLRFVNRGFGNDCIVNLPGGVKDLKFGPVPKILSWEPIGNNLACEIEWQVVVHVPHCVGTTRDRGILAFNYEADFSIDNGHTTRTISGYIEIAQTRAGKRAPDCADLYRHLLKPALPDGFERKHNHRVSKDKSRLDFTITDSEIPSKFALPKGVTHATGRHRASWSRNNRGATQLRNSISMELEMVPGVSQSQAWAIFGQIVKKRIDFAKKQNKLPVLLDELTAEEDIWGRASSFSVGYRILKTCGACLTKHSGLWQPIDTDWRRWKLSMADVFHERGHAGLGIGSGDAIVDLCGAASTLSTGGPSETPSEPRPTFATTFKNDYPPPDTSYLKYDQTIVPSRERPVQRQSVLQVSESTSDLIGSDLDEKTPFSFGSPGGTSDVIQEGGRSRYSVQLIGSAMRAGYEIPRPSLESLGKQTATETYFKMMQTIVGNWFGVPIFQAMWVGDYALGNSPGQMKMEENIKEKVDQNGKALCDC